MDTAGYRHRLGEVGSVADRPSDPPAPRAPLRTYFSVSEDGRDLMLLAELRTWLRYQERCGWLTSGICRAEIVAGRNKAAVAAERLRQADLVFVLLSMEYLRSEDCMSAELAQALALQDAGLLRLVLIHLRSVPLGELVVPVNGKQYDLRQWEWHPRTRKEPVDHEKRHRRETAWQLVEHEVRTVAVQFCQSRPPAPLTPEELALYCQGDDGGLGSFLDRFSGVIGAGLAAGAGRPFLAAQQREIASFLYWDLFCGPQAAHLLFDSHRDRSFAHFLFKIAHLLGQDLVR